MGQRNSAQSLQRTMNHILKDLPFVKCYLDDIIVFSDNHEQHLQHVRQLFEVLRAAKLRINPDKGALGKDEVIFLGYIVSAKGFKPPPHKIQAIVEYPRPKSSTELRRYLGLLNYYRRCIPAAASILSPLNELLKGIPSKKKKADITWTPEADSSFQLSKDAISQATSSTFLRADAPLALRSDASDTAIGAALEQQDKQGTWRPLAFFSRKLSDTEKRYSTYDRELLAIFASLKHFQRILEGRCFTIFTDHKPLTFASLQRSDKASPRQSRQLDFILQFNCQIFHVKGEENVVADALSRVATIDLPSTLSAEIISRAQAVDPELKDIKSNSSLDIQLIKCNELDIFCDVSTGRVRPYLPLTLRRTAFDNLHNLAHPGVKSTIKLVSSKYVWPDMRKEIGNWARTCEACQKCKVHRHNRSLLGDFNTPGQRFDHIHIDLIKLPLCQGFQYCLTIIDRFTRWLEAVPVPDQQASTVAKALVNRWISLYGTPLTITSDQGTQFESAIFSELLKLLGTTRVRTTPYHPQSNGMVERTHRTLKAALMCNRDVPWPDQLPLTLLGLRTSFKDDLQASPAELLYGTTLRVPGDFFIHKKDHQACPASFVESLRHLAQSILPARASRHVQNSTFTYKDLKTCSHVFKRVDSIKKPLQPPYTGPHKVIQRINNKNFIIDFNGRQSTISTDALKPAYLASSDTSNSSQPTSISSPTLSNDIVTPPQPVLEKLALNTKLRSILKNVSQPRMKDVSRPRLSKHVSFCPLPADNTGEGVIVATRSSRRIRTMKNRAA